MKFLVIYTQKGDGCDYTIGCGVRVETIEARDETDLVKHLTNKIVNGDRDDRDFRLESIRYVPLKEVTTFGLAQARAIRDTKREADRRSEAAAAERAQYERLRKKYEGG